eukprot:5109694-Prymnesium_polylepis.2
MLHVSSVLTTAHMCSVDLGAHQGQCQWLGAPGVHDVAFHYPRWTTALWAIISSTYNAFKCTQTHHTTASSASPRAASPPRRAHPHLFTIYTGLAH